MKLQKSSTFYIWIFMLQFPLSKWLMINAHLISFFPFSFFFLKKLMLDFNLQVLLDTFKQVNLGFIKEVWAELLSRLVSLPHVSLSELPSFWFLFSSWFRLCCLSLFWSLRNYFLNHNVLAFWHGFWFQSSLTGMRLIRMQNQIYFENLLHSKL